MNRWARIGHSVGRSLLVALLGLWIGLVVGMPTAIASIHVYPEGDGQVMVRSLQTVRDRQDQAWQLTLFKRSQAGQLRSVHLRVVGFPGSAVIQHPDPLRLSVRDRGWTAADVFTANTPFPDSVGEYDLMSVMAELTRTSPMQLLIPTANSATEVIVPAQVVQEWRDLVAQH